MDESLYRIGVLATRTGVSTHLLRIWEERYALLTPRRSPAGYRLYGPVEEARVRRMVQLRAHGVAAAEAAAAVLASADATPNSTPDSRPDSPLPDPLLSARELPELLEGLREAFGRYDDDAFHAVVDTALASHTVETVLSELVFPFLRRLGDDWEAGTLSVAQEHYGSGLARGRMVGLTPHLSRRTPGGTTAVLACTPFERHDIGLLGLDLSLRERGWTPHFLGADTPLADTVATCRDVSADVLVLCGTEPHMFAAQLDQHAEDLAAMRSATLLALGGPAATVEVARRHEALLLPPDVAAAAEALAPTPLVAVGS